MTQLVLMKYIQFMMNISPNDKYAKKPEIKKIKIKIDARRFTNSFVRS
jgi:hypothetical protein